MEYQKFYEKLLDILREKYPKRSGALKELAADLRMDQKSLARRMRGETPFTVEEITKICLLLNISFDTLLFSLDETVHPMKIYIRDLAAPFMPESFRNLFMGMEYTALDRENGHAFLCSNMIPNGLYAAYPQLSRFIYYAWSYRRYPDQYTTLADFRLSDEMSSVITRFGTQAREVRHSEYLLSNNFMDNLSEYILFFHEMGLLTRYCSHILIQELKQLLDEIEKSARRRMWPGTDNKVDIFITSVGIPHSLLITENSYCKVAIIYAFFLNPIITIHPETFVEIKTQAYSMLRHSESISLSGEKKRAVFIKKQREALAKLAQSLEIR